MDAQFSERFETSAPPPPTRSSTWIEQALALLRRTLGAGVRTINTIRARGLVRPVLMIGGAVLVALIATFVWFSGGRYVSTDDAYVHAAKLMVSAEVSGGSSAKSTCTKGRS